MKKGILAASRRPTLERNAVLILEVRENTDDGARALQRRLVRAAHQAHALVAESVEKLSAATDQIIPRINVQVQPHYGDKHGISSYLKSGKITSECRVVVFLDPMHDDTDASQIRQSGISHLVGVRVGERFGWRSSSGGLDALIGIDVEDVSYLIHDIALDVAMFYSWFEEESGVAPSLSHRSSASRRKAQFAALRNLSSYFGPILDKDISYFSLASHCRKSRNSFSYEVYEGIWRQFVSHENLLVNTGDAPVLDGSISQIAAILFAAHKYSGMLSRQRVARSVRDLTSGTYLLITAGRKPHSGRKKIIVGNLLGAATWKKRLWKIASFSEFDRYSREAAAGYITLFKFRVP